MKEGDAVATATAASMSMWSMCDPEHARLKAIAEARHHLDLPHMEAITVDALVHLVRCAGVTVGADTPFVHAGLDSLTALQLRNAIQEAVRPHLALPVTLMFEQTTVRKVIGFIEDHQPSQQGPELQPATGALQVAPTVVVLRALSCKLPASVDRPSLLQRIASSNYAADERVGGYFIDRPELFAASLFGIVAAEAKDMDPHHKHVLEQSYAALHAAGFSKRAVSGTNMGVAAAMWNTEFRYNDVSSVYNLANISISVASGRVSYVLGLHGPCTSIDTACSSSLVASHSAARALQHGECEQYLV